MTDRPAVHVCLGIWGALPLVSFFSVIYPMGKGVLKLKSPEVCEPSAWYLNDYLALDSDFLKA